MSDIRTQALACRDAATAIAALDNTARRLLLLDMAQAIDSQTDTILAANEKDMAQAAAKGVQGAMLDRLRLDAGRVATIANAVREVADLPDPVGQVTRRDQLPNGLAIERVRIPLGVITMIYEARPNVTADAAALCLKAGNAVILRGGSEALHSNTAIAAALHVALQKHGIPAAAVTLVEDLRRETMVELLQLADIIDLAMMVGYWGPVPEAAWEKVRKAYGTSAERAYQGAIEMVSDRTYLSQCLAKMHMAPALADQLPAVLRGESTFSQIARQDIDQAPAGIKAAASGVRAIYSRVLNTTPAMPEADDEQDAAQHESPQGK